MTIRRATLLCLAVTLLAAGCGGRREPAAAAPSSGLAAALRDIGGAPAALSVSEPMRPFFAAGLGFIVLGGLVLCLGGRGGGLTLLALGALTTATGVLFVQYPWAVLLLALAAGGAAALAAHDRLRARRELSRSREALAAAAEVIQKLPEGEAMKRGLVAMGAKTEAKVRSVITPIKEELRRDGRIPS